MAYNLYLIGSLVLTVIALILFFAGWMVGRKVTLSDADRRNSSNLLIAGMVFLALGLIATLIYAFKPTLGAKYIATGVPITVPAVAGVRPVNVV